MKQILLAIIGVFVLLWMSGCVSDSDHFYIGFGPGAGIIHLPVLQHEH